MDLEKFVIQSLKEKGYPIYYSNYRIKNVRHTITEYDVVSENFIIEVKSGDVPFTNFRQFGTQLKYLPEGYRFYCYCPNKKDEEIKELREYYLGGSNSLLDEFIPERVIFVNNLEVIFQRETFTNEVNLLSQREFTKLLSLTLTELKKFSKIWMTYETFIYTYICCKFNNDYYNLNEVPQVMHSKKIENLINQGIIQIVDTLSDNKPFIATRTPKKAFILGEDGEEGRIKIKKYFYLQTTKDLLEKIYLHNSLPFIQNVTRMCNCGKNYFFCKVKSGLCRECYNTKIKYTNKEMDEFEEIKIEYNNIQIKRVTLNGENLYSDNSLYSSYQSFYKKGEENKPYVIYSHTYDENKIIKTVNILITNVDKKEPNTYSITRNYVEGILKDEKYYKNYTLEKSIKY